MNPLLLGGVALAAGLAFMMGSKKAKAKEPSTSLEVDSATSKDTGDVYVPPETLGPVGTGTVSPTQPIPVAEPTKAPPSEVVSPPPPTVVRSPGLPPMPVSSGTGTTSGATSIAKDGSIDDAFDQLVASAIAKGDIELLRQLALQAQNRGLTDVAESIREEIARLTESAPEPTPIIQPLPIEAPVTIPTGRATISMAAGSRGTDVKVWQKVIGVTQDGIFGPITDKATRDWQRRHPPLVVDGIVGPKTWSMAYALNPWLATEDRTTTETAPTPAPAPNQLTQFATMSASDQELLRLIASKPTIRQGSRGTAVTEWQRLIHIAPVDGIFGPITDKATRDFQRSRGLVVDGIVGPKTWGSALSNPPSAPAQLPAPAPAPPPAPEPTVVESDSRRAAQELTQYLTSIGGLAGRWKEDRNRVKGYQSRLGVSTDGMYGRGTARAVILQGFVPVVPYYWPSSGTSAAKAEFTALVNQYASTDPNRKSQWDKLLSDIQRS